LKVHVGLKGAKNRQVRKNDIGTMIDPLPYVGLVPKNKSLSFEKPRAFHEIRKLDRTFGWVVFKQGLNYTEALHQRRRWHAG